MSTDAARRSRVAGAGMPQEAAVQIRTFRASSVERAWEFARRELGSGVELVTTRTTREGGFLGLGGRRLVEITVA
ncbi:MAG: hypothetical protein ACO3NL_03575, partial [Phycisphaerales bacterium]